MKSNHTNVIKMCMCMEWNGMSGDMTNSLPWIISLIYYYYFSWIWVIHFFWHALLACGIPYWGMHLFYFNIPFEHVAYLLSVCIFSFFLIAHSINNMERMIMKQSRSFYFMDGWWIMLIPSVGILHMNIGIYMILNTWYEKILARITQFDKTQWNNK